MGSLLLIRETIQKSVPSLLKLFPIVKNIFRVNLNHNKSVSAK